MLIKKDSHRSPWAFSLPFLLIFLLSPLTALSSAELVNCRYLKSSGQEIQLEITVSSPPPTTLIVVQNIPGERMIQSASPMFNKYNESRGEAKWLLKGLGPGRFVLAIRLDQPVSAGQVNGEIRYKNPVTGQMISMPTLP